MSNKITPVASTNNIVYTSFRFSLLVPSRLSIQALVTCTCNSNRSAPLLIWKHTTSYANQHPELQRFTLMSSRPIVSLLDLCLSIRFLSTTKEHIACIQLRVPCRHVSNNPLTVFLSQKLPNSTFTPALMITGS
jgi:hypothetical protein